MDTARVLLIVVETPAQRAQLNRLLGSTPHHLVYAADGEDAYDRFHEIKPHLVIAHVEAPRLDGGRLCQLVRQRLGGSATPFLLVGAPESEADGHRRAVEVEADGFVTFPLTDAMVSMQIEPLLDRGRSTTDVKARPLAPDSVRSETDDIEGPVRVEGDTEESPSLLGSALEPSFDSTTDASPASHGRAEAVDIDTVVSYNNPFFEADPSPNVQIGGGGEEPVTHVAIEAPMLDSPEPLGVLSDAVRPRIDPLEEPPISGIAALGPERPSTAKSRLIEEVPRERTPTGDSGERSTPGPMLRRGLDESQLGKRLARRVRTMYRMLAEADAAQLLGVDRHADYDTIRKAYEELSLEFHPDRFFLLRSGDLKEKIYAIYRKVAEAFEALADTNAPGAEQKAAASARGALTIVATTDAGQRYADLAMAAFAAGDYNHARLMLELAQTKERNNPSVLHALDTVVHALRSAHSA